MLIFLAQCLIFVGRYYLLEGPGQFCPTRCALSTFSVGQTLAVAKTLILSYNEGMRELLQSLIPSATKIPTRTSGVAVHNFYPTAFDILYFGLSAITKINAIV